MHRVEEERLQKYLSRSKVCSRRQAEKMIEAGRITVNGKVPILGAKVRPELDEVRIDGKIVEPESFDYILLHKPKGYLSTRRDDRGRRTIMELLGSLADTYLYPVGRLDLDSSGLILLTNDGWLAQRMLHPSYEVEKTYRVRLSRDLSDGELESFRSGLRLEGKRTAPASIRRLEDSLAPHWYEVELREGRKRQIRKMIAELGARVLQLLRIRMGPMSIRGIPEGRHRRLKQEEVKALRASCSAREKRIGRKKRRS